MCVSMIKGLKEEGIHVKKLIMDDDSTSIAKARTECDPSFIKACDSNHLKIAFTSKLYKLSQKHKSLSTPIIGHITTCFMYAIKQSDQNEDNISKSLSAIVPHLYGDHGLCNEKWCGFLTNPESYIPKNLPYKRNPTNENLKKDLSDLIKDYSANTSKLVNVGSSQKNESFNRKVLAKNPKHLHFSGSEGTCFRVASAVAESNIGHFYAR